MFTWNKDTLGRACLLATNKDDLGRKRVRRRRSPGVGACLCNFNEICESFSASSCPEEKRVGAAGLRIQSRAAVKRGQWNKTYSGDCDVD
jgi:hypothetical protein